MVVLSLQSSVVSKQNREPIADNGELQPDSFTRCQICEYAVGPSTCALMFDTISGSV
jgi:hypothetical protein